MGVSGCKSDTPLPRLLESRIPLRDRYKVTLPRLQVLAPSTTTEIEEQYDLTAAAAPSRFCQAYRLPSGASMAHFLGRPLK